MTDNEYQKYNDEINKIHNQDFSHLKEKEFIKKVSLLSPQSYGLKIEKFISKKIKSKFVHANKNRGDLNLKGKYIEVKSSIITKRNPYLNMVQIRLYQDLDYYLCCAFDVRDISKYKSYYYLLTHDEMMDEMALLSTSNAHGTKDSLKNNENIELRYSLFIYNENKTFKRWNKKYKYNSFSAIISKIKG